MQKERKDRKDREDSILFIDAKEIVDKSTDKAFCVDAGKGEGEDGRLILDWLPKSQCWPAEDQKDVFCVPEWLAKTKELI